MKVKLLGFVLLLASTALVSGCAIGAQSGEETLSAGRYVYQMEIIKSDINRKQMEVRGKTNTLSTQEILDRSQIKYKIINEKLSELDGVISTASKTWYLYINGKKMDELFNNSVSPSDIIAWQYE